MEKRREPGRLAAGGAPARASNVARSRTCRDQAERRFRPRARRARSTALAALGAHASAETMGLGALAVVGLERALQRMASSRSAARTGAGDHAGGGQTSVGRPSAVARCATSSAVWGKSSTTPCRLQRTRCYVAAPRSAPAGTSANFPGGLSRSTAGRTGADTSRPISTPVDAPVDNDVDGPAWSGRTVA